jgi:hypothetical protein
MHAEANDRPAPATPAPEAVDRDDQSERYGPLAIARYLKDDGRALILYERADPEAA